MLLHGQCMLVTHWIFFVLQQIGYRVNILNESCEVFKLTEPFRPIGIPKTATYLGEAYLGSAESNHAGLKVQHWEDRSPAGIGHCWGSGPVSDTSFFADITSRQHCCAIEQEVMQEY